MRRKQKINNKLILTLIILSIAIFIFTQITPKSAPINSDTVWVTRVVDGDTIKVKFNGIPERVRLLGINTPESVHPNPALNTKEGKIASNYTKKELEGKKVKLEFEGNKRDKYGRLLAYVWIGDELFNNTLLKNGYAKTYMLKKSSKYYSTFKNSENSAKKQKLGVWKNN